jgi:CDGSH-type Zn-finger protein
MARLIKRLRAEPFAVAVGGETKWICGCGLSRNQPFCDGTHKTARDEATGSLCWYDSAGQRHETIDAFADIRHE